MADVDQDHVPAPEETDDLRTEEKDHALDRVIEEGRPRLHRRWYDLMATGVVAGIEVGIGVLALVAVESATGSRELAAIAFAIGLVALRLGHSELFTEGFHVPVMVVAAKEATWWQLLRLWAGTLVGNLVGGWVVAWLMATGLPELHEAAVESAAHFAEASLDLQTFCLAVLAGAAITLLTRMQNGTDDAVAQILVTIGIAFVIVGTGLFHSILDSIIIFLAIHTGTADFGYVDWFPWFWFTVAGNMVGGLGLITLLRLVRSQKRLESWRHTEAKADR